jgi:type VI secretion system secreted protein Hcp
MRPRRRMKNKFFLALICLGFAPVVFAAGWQGFLRLDTVTGGSADPSHHGWMNVQSATTAPISNSGGKGTSGYFNFQKSMDIASPALALACARGQNIASGTLDLAGTNASLAVFLHLNLTNVNVASVSTSGAGGVPAETISLGAAVQAWTYTEFNPTNGLAVTNQGALLDFTSPNFSGTRGAAVFMSTGVRNAAGVQLGWNAAVAASYRIYAVVSLTHPFLPIAVVTNAPGPATYNVTPASPAMFYIVEQLPAGY